jgi:putative membrane protein
MIRFLLRLLFTGVAIEAAIHAVPGITFSGDWLPLLEVTLVFTLINALVRPLLKAASCCFILITLGLFMLVINALMLWLTSAVSGDLGLGFHVAGFKAAFWGALVISVVNGVLSIFIPKKKKRDEEMN